MLLPAYLVPDDADEMTRRDENAKHLRAAVASINTIRERAIGDLRRRQVLDLPHTMILCRTPGNQASFGQLAAIDSPPTRDLPSLGSGEERGHAARRKYRWWSPPTIDSS